jgi:hypothetical protein
MPEQERSKFRARLYNPAASDVNAMKTRTLVLLAVAIGISACKTSGQSPAPPAPGPRTGTAPPAPAPNPNPAPPNPPQPTPLAISVPPPAPLAAAVPDQPVIATDTAPAAPAKTYEDIIRLKEAGRSDEFLLKKVRTDNVNYHLTTAEVQSLRAAGVSQAVLEAMLRSGQPGR